MATKKHSLANVRILQYGFLLYAVAVFVQQIARVGDMHTSVEVGVIGLQMVGCLLVFWGFHKMIGEGASFKRGRAAAVVALALLLLESIKVLVGIKNALGESTFVNIIVIFFSFMAMMVLVYAYDMAYVGSRKAAGETEVHDEWSFWLILGLVLALVAVISPLMRLFSNSVVAYGATAVLGLVAVGVQVWALLRIQQAYAGEGTVEGSQVADNISQAYGEETAGRRSRQSLRMTRKRSNK